MDSISSDLSSAGDGEADLITPEMRACFFKESEDVLDQAEQTLLHLSDAPNDREAIALVFRSVHSFKGNCGFFGYAPMERSVHHLESALDLARNSDQPLSILLINAALACVDIYRKSLYGDPMAALPDPEGILARMAAWEASGLQQPAEAASSVAVRVSPPVDNRSTGPEGQVEGTSPLSGGRRDLRVDLGKLDHLMDLVGELVISTGMIFNYPTLRSDNDPHLERIVHQLRGVVSELQSVALGVRMVPVEGLFRKMNRLVHDLSLKEGKQVKLELRGMETEVDKTLVDHVSDPLVHMIRNAIDHGIENPSERLAAGKGETGTLTLSAGQEGGEICITVEDDGRGLSRDKILKKAIERDLFDGDSSALTDDEVFQFIFRPGFSTAESITATSGRGVGMDVVKSNVDKLGGRIQIKSVSGHGSQIILRIPLTLTIMEGMQVQVGSSHFILPLVAVRESLAPTRDQVVTLLDQGDILMLRGKSLPIVRLSRLLGMADASEDLTRGLLIHVTARDLSYCLAVDDLLGQKQTVVKALPPYFGQVPGVSGCSILDDGTIALILDVASLPVLSNRQNKSNAPFKALPTDSP